MKREIPIAVIILALAAGPTFAVGTVAAATGHGTGGRAALALASALEDEELVEASKRRLDDEPRGDAAKMFFLSLAVPGGGQIARGEKRGYLYLAAEIAFWGAYYVLNEKGEEEVSEFETFADGHWDYDGYSAWYDVYCEGCVGDSCGSDYDCRPLAGYGTGEYYEDIGKYSTYWKWWSDDGVGSSNPEYLSVRNTYWQMRQTSNRHLRNARYYMTAAFLNHVASAVDALLFGRSAEPGVSGDGHAGIEFSVPGDATGIRCAVVARY